MKKGIASTIIDFIIKREIVKNDNDDEFLTKYESIITLVFLVQRS